MDAEQATPPISAQLAQLLNPPAAVSTVDLKNTTFGSSHRPSQQFPEFPESLILPQFVRSWLQPADKPVVREFSGSGDEAMDGKFLGAEKKIYTTDSAYREVPATIQSEKSEAKQDSTLRIYYVNGMGTSVASAQSEMQQIADLLGASVVGIYNATDGNILDVTQAVTDKWGVRLNPAVETLKSVILDAAEKEEGIHIAAESHGAVIVSRALSDARDELVIKGLSEKEILEKLGRFRVETFGGASWSFIDGPQYVHYVNCCDPVPYYFGLTSVGLESDKYRELEAKLDKPLWMTAITSLGWLADIDSFVERNPGRGARIVRFDCPAPHDWLKAHMLGTYLKARMKFDDAYKSDDVRAGASFVSEASLGTFGKWSLLAALTYGSWRFTKYAVGLILSRAIAALSVVRNFGRAPRRVEEVVPIEEAVAPAFISRAA